MKRYLEVIMAVLLLLMAFFLSRQGAFLASGQKQEQKKGYVVVIDPGHGGNDPGKIGISGALEKEINLQIAKKLQLLLEAEDVTVILTRDSDDGLYQESDRNKKIADMRARCTLIEETQPDLVISIHQNSYHQESAQGGQCFYYTGSKEAEELAKRIQEQFWKLDESSKRQIQANSSYYLLKKTSVPTVIAECGFLSNYEEEGKLTQESYQEKVAWAIHLAILEYLNR
jgi:N-acetylmuramoyl-L-alanine amidase